MRIFILLSLTLLVSAQSLSQVQQVDLVSEGVKLNAYLYEGAGKYNKPTVIWLHGNPGSKEEGTSEWTRDLAKSGINVLRFNYRGLWGNKGEFTLTHAIEDLYNTIDFLTQPDHSVKYRIDTNRLIIGGFSFGTAVGLTGAVYDDRIDDVVCISPCDHSFFGRQFMDPDSEYREFLEQAMDELFLPNGILPQDREIFIRDLTNHINRNNMVKHAEKLLSKRLLVIAGYNDLICPVEDHWFPLYRELMKLDHPNLRIKINDCPHSCDPPLPLAKIISEWIQGND